MTKTTERSNDSADQGVNESPATPPDVSITDGPMEPEPTPQRVINPYTTGCKIAKISSSDRYFDITTFICISKEYIYTLICHDESLKTKPWYSLWQLWEDK